MIIKHREYQRILDRSVRLDTTELRPIPADAQPLVALARAGAMDMMVWCFHSLNPGPSALRAGWKRRVEHCT